MDPPVSLCLQPLLQILYVNMSEELSNHLQILHAVGCSAEIGKEVQLSRYIDFNLLEDLASQRLQPVMAWKFFPKLGNLGTSYPAKLLLSTCPYLEKVPGPGGLTLSESCL